MSARGYAFRSVRPQLSCFPHPHPRYLSSATAAAAAAAGRERCWLSSQCILVGDSRCIFIVFITRSAGNNCLHCSQASLVLSLSQYSHNEHWTATRESLSSYYSYGDWGLENSPLYSEYPLLGDSIVFVCSAPCFLIGLHSNRCFYSVSSS